jgi:3-isopropylmalate dehydrogenase
MYVVIICANSLTQSAHLIPTCGNIAWDKMAYSVSEVQRITRVAATLAMQADPPLQLTSIDKANVLATSRLWRKVVTETIKNEFPALVPKLKHQVYKLSIP